MTRALLAVIAVAIMGSAFVRAAAAGAAIEFTPPEVTVARGTQASILATITNISQERVYISGLVSELTSELAADTCSDAFLGNAPAFLEPGEAWQGLLLSLDVAPTAELGERVIGVHLIGGPDEDAGDDIAVNWFRVSILGSTDVVEERPPVTLALEGVTPNPLRGNAVSGLNVTFALPNSSTAKLELLDVSGRRVVQREVGSLGPGKHMVSLAPSRRLAAGLYWVRLVQGKDERVIRVSVLN